MSIRSRQVAFYADLGSADGEVPGGDESAFLGERVGVVCVDFGHADQGGSGVGEVPDDLGEAGLVRADRELADAMLLEFVEDVGHVRVVETFGEVEQLIARR